VSRSRSPTAPALDVLLRRAQRAVRVRVDIRVEDLIVLLKALLPAAR
jgi:hypothetical protein